MQTGKIEDALSPPATTQPAKRKRGKYSSTLINEIGSHDKRQKKYLRSLEGLKAHRDQQEITRLATIMEAIKPKDPKSEGLQLGEKGKRPTPEIGQSASCAITASVLTILTKKSPKQLKLLIDSGSTVHVIRDKSLFKTCLPSNREVLDAGGKMHRVACVGRVDILLPTTRGPQLITLNGCVCIPNFAADIVSTKRLRHLDGYWVHGPPKQVGYMISKERVRTTFTKLPDGLECIDATEPTTGVHYNRTFAARDGKVTFADWLQSATEEELKQRILEPHIGDKALHTARIRDRLAVAGIYIPRPEHAGTDELARLHLLAGHSNVRTVAQYAHNYMSKKDKKKLGRAAEFFCKHCARTKATRASASKKKVTQPEAKAWSKMAMDVIGPFPTPSIVGAYKYCILFCCKITGMTRILSLSSLQQIANRINEQYRWIQAEHPAAMQAPELERQVVPLAVKLRSDHASYFRTAQALEVYGRYNVKHTMSSPHRQHQNGICERNYRTLKESANACRAHAELGNEYWFLALRHAAMIHNELPTARNGGLPPALAAFGRQPNLSKFRIFGCDAYHVRPKSNVGEHRALMGMYVGYYEDSDSHMILLPQSQGGPARLRRYQTLQSGASPTMTRRRLLYTQHAVFDDKKLPQSVLDGTVPIEWPSYQPYHQDDENSVIDEIEIFGDGHTTAEVPVQDRGGPDTLDLDYHRAHCTSSISGCHCALNPVTKEDAKRRLHADNASITVPLYDTTSHLTATPRCLAAGGILTSWKKAQRTPESELYRVARDAEVKQMIDRNIVEKRPISDVPQNTTIFRSLMNFTLKTTVDHQIIKAKARWCFDGSTQIQGLHYNESTTYTVRHSTVRAHLAMAARKRLRVRSLDVPGAFLHAPALKTLWMRSPHDQKTYTESGEEEVWAVKGNMYGRVEAAKLWHDHLAAFLNKHGYESSTSDPCLFVKDEGDGHWTQMVWHVDDCCYWSTDPAKREELEKLITEEYGDCGIHEPTLFLGINIQQGNDEIHISSKTLIERAAKHFFKQEDLTLINTARATTPFPSHNSAMGDNVNLDDCPDAMKGEAPLDKPYRELVGTLLFVTITTRPDCAWHTSQLGRVQSNPGKRHWQLACSVLRYLLATSDLGISYRPVLAPMEYYTDASWGDVRPSTVKQTNLYKKIGGKYVSVPDITLIDVTDPDARRSSFGYLAILAGGPISWRSQVQPGRRALSTCEAELHAATEAAKDCLHMKALVGDMHLEHTEPIQMHEDNQSTIRVIQRMGITQRTKHYELRLYFLRDLVDVIHITYCPTQKMLADILTKNLPAETLRGLREQLVSKFNDRHDMPA